MQKRNSMGQYEVLPVPALERISLYLSFEDLLKCSHVCHHWRLFYAYTVQWERICRRTGVSNSVLDVVVSNDRFSQRFYMEVYFAHIRINRNWVRGLYHLKKRDTGWEVTAMDYKGGLLAIVGSFRMEIWKMIPDMARMNVVSLIDVERPRDVILLQSFVMVVGRMYGLEELSTRMIVFKIHDPRTVVPIYVRQIEVGCRPVVHLTSNGIAVWVDIGKRHMVEGNAKGNVDDQIAADISKDTKVNRDTVSQGEGAENNCENQAVSGFSKDVKVNRDIVRQRGGAENKCKNQAESGFSKDAKDNVGIMNSEEDGESNCGNQAAVGLNKDAKIDLGIMSRHYNEEEVDGSYVSGDVGISLTENKPSVCVEDVIKRKYSFRVSIPKEFHKSLWRNRVTIATHDGCLYATIPGEKFEIHLLKWSFSDTSVAPTLVFQKGIGLNSIQDIKIMCSNKMLVVASAYNVRVFRPDGSLLVRPFGQKQSGCYVKEIQLAKYADAVSMLGGAHSSEEVIIVGYSNALILVYTAAGRNLIRITTAEDIHRFMVMKQYLIISLLPSQHAPSIVAVQQFGDGTNINTVQCKEGTQPWSLFVNVDATGVCIVSSTNEDNTSLQFLDFVARNTEYEYEKSKFHNLKYVNQMLCVF